MKRLMLALLLLCFTGCSIQIPDPEVIWGPKELPQANVPPGCRQWNWTSGGPTNGSCTHASIISLARWVCQPKFADWWQKNHGGGEDPTSLTRQLDKAGVQYAMTFNKADVKFLEWACRTRRGCAVAIYGRAHMVALVGLTEKWAIILDNNDTSRFIYVPRKNFINEWLWSDSWAIALMYAPCPPKTIAASKGKHVQETLIDRNHFSDHPVYKGGRD